MASVINSYIMRLANWIKSGFCVIAIVLFLLVIGLIAVSYSKICLMIHQTSNDLYYATLILAPILIYAIASGKMKMLKIGSLEAEFQEIANQRIEPSPVEPIKTLDIQKGPEQELSRKIRDLKKSLIYKEKKIKPIILTLSLGAENYDGTQLMEYIKKLLCDFESFKLIVILDRNRHVKAYIHPRHLQITLSCNDNNGSRKNFIDALNSGDYRKIIQIPGMITAVIKEHDTNIDALKKMLYEEIEILAVIDEDRNLIGIVEQDRLLRMILIKSIIEIK